MISEEIKNFPKQFEFVPKVENSKALKKTDSFLVCGMGGSNLAAGLIKTWNPNLNIFEHRNYGLPNLPPAILKKSLVIASSYSGNTEETISSFQEAIKKKIPVAVVSAGGKLLDLARKFKKPHIQFHSGRIQPRSAVGYSIRAVLKLMENRAGLAETGKLADFLKSYEVERAGAALAKKLKGRVPIIYTSERNAAIGYNWKIKINETAKTPAFRNVFPELNHNEMTSYDVQLNTKDLSRKFYFLILKDPADHPRILKRMNVTERLLRDREFLVETMILNGKSAFHKIFSSLLVADWTAYYLSKEYRVEATEVPMVEEFKRLIK